MKLHIEYNANFIQSKDTVEINPNAVFMITPAIDEDYWLMRVPVSENQAVVCFPKFDTIGIGFQHEKYWNTNLPYNMNAEEIYHHIRYNKGDKKIRKWTVIQAIIMLQNAIMEYRRKQREKANVASHD